MELPSVPIVDEDCISWAAPQIWLIKQTEAISFPSCYKLPSYLRLTSALCFSNVVMSTASASLECDRIIICESYYDQSRCESKLSVKIALKDILLECHCLAEQQQYWTWPSSCTAVQFFRLLTGLFSALWSLLYDLSNSWLVDTNGMVHNEHPLQFNSSISTQKGCYCQSLNDLYAGLCMLWY